MSKRSSAQKIKIFAAAGGSQVVRRTSEEQAFELERRGVLQRVESQSGELLGFRQVRDRNE